jgi:hypothetical protein
VAIGQINNNPKLKGWNKQTNNPENKNESESSQARGGDLWVQRNTRLLVVHHAHSQRRFFDRYASIILYIKKKLYRQNLMLQSGFTFLQATFFFFF